MLRLIKAILNLFKKEEPPKGEQKETVVLPDLMTLIKKYEGCRLEAYRCPAGVWTIGWGTTFYPDGSRVKKGDKITQQQADNILQWYCVEHIKLPKGQFTVYQKTALYSVIYNTGLANFNRSKCKKAIESQDWETAFREWNWDKGGGKVLQGLRKRRKEERLLFFTEVLDVDLLEKKYYS